jgi:hypothetical protein
MVLEAWFIIDVGFPHHSWCSGVVGIIVPIGVIKDIELSL